MAHSYSLIDWFAEARREKVGASEEKGTDLEPDVPLALG